MTEEAQKELRLADIQTSLAVLASSSKTRDSQIAEMKDTLNKHMEHEERLFSKIFGKIDDLEHRVTKAEGAVTGARWILAIITGIAAFLGIKGGLN